MRHSDAFELGHDDGGRAGYSGRDRVGYRWLENLRQSTELFGDPQRCVHIGDRESDIYELLCTAKDDQKDIGNRKGGMTFTELRAHLTNIHKLAVPSPSLGSLADVGAYPLLASEQQKSFFRRS